MAKVRPDASEQAYSIIINKDGLITAIEFQFVEITDDGVFEPVPTSRQVAIPNAFDELTPGEKGQLNAVITILRNLRDSEFPIT